MIGRRVLAATAALALLVIMVAGTGTAAAQGGMKGGITADTSGGVICTLNVAVTWPKKHNQDTLSATLNSPSGAHFDFATAVGTDTAWTSPTDDATYNATTSGVWTATVQLYDASGKVLASWSGSALLPCQ